MLCCLFFFLLLRLPPGSTLFPYTTLFRSCAATRATWRDAAPTRRACGSRGRSVCRPLRMVVEEAAADPRVRSEEHTSELQSHSDLVCRLLLEKKKKKKTIQLRGNNTTTPE